MARIYKRKSIWYLDYSIKTETQTHRIRKAIGKSEKVARLAKADIELKIEKFKAGFLSPSISIDTFFLQTENRIKRNSPKTFQRYSEVLANFKKYLAKKNIKIQNIQQLTPDIFDKFADFELSRGLHKNTINYELDRLHGFFLFYVKNNFLDRSPVAMAHRFSKQKKTPRFLSQKEIAALFKVISPRFKPFFTTLLYTGLRLQELLNLRWDSIQSDILIVAPSADWQPKTQSSIRSIPLHPKVIKAIKLRKELNESEIYIFSNRQGKKYSKNILLRILKRYTKKAGISNVTIHTFRHTFASRLVQQGISIYQVKEWLGHSSVKQTEIYSHLIPPQNAKLIRKLSF